MQFLWQFLDDIIGKGISLGVLLELIFYFAIRIIPQAVPVTILIASVMVFGNLAEKYELSSMKSAGVSLTRIMLAGFVLSVFTAAFSLFSSNYLKPRANYKFLQRFISVKRQDLTLSIEEGVFAKDFKNFVIKVGEKKPDGESIEDVLIYDTSDADRRKINMLIADRGKMYSSSDSDFFIMDLEQGEQYRELKSSKKGTNQFIRTKFDSWRKAFDMSDFDFEAQKLNQSSKKHDLLNSRQLLQGIDSIDNKLLDNRKKLHHNFGELLNIETIKDEKKKDERKEATRFSNQMSSAIMKKDKQIKENLASSKKYKKVFPQKAEIRMDTISSLLQCFKKEKHYAVLNSAKTVAQRSRDNLKQVEREEKIMNISRAKYLHKYHQQYSWALICIVFLFIGAPLGSIVKKGGYGYPLLIAIIFFMIFIIVNIMGEKLTNTGEMDPVFAAWLPNIILIPFALIISYKALNDSNFTLIKRLTAKLTKT